MRLGSVIVLVESRLDRLEGCTILNADEIDVPEHLEDIKPGDDYPPVVLRLDNGEVFVAYVLRRLKSDKK